MSNRNQTFARRVEYGLAAIVNEWISKSDWPVYGPHWDDPTSDGWILVDSKGNRVSKFDLFVRFEAVE